MHAKGRLVCGLFSAPALVVEPSIYVTRAKRQRKHGVTPHGYAHDEHSLQLGARMWLNIKRYGENDMDQKDFDAALQKRHQEIVRHPVDCDRLCRVAKERLGLHVSPADAQTVWQGWSNSVAAGWLHMDDDDEIERAIRWFVERP